MWGGGDFKVCGGIVVELRKNTGLDMIMDHNPDLDFTAYDSIHGIKTNTQANRLSKFS